MGHESVRWGRVDSPEALPAALADLEASTEASDEPVFLVCAHGRHDACCAVRGRPVAAVLAATHAERTWETTHTGGDRFAANVVLLPHGLVLGRVPATEAGTIADRYCAGEVDPALVRGRAGLAPAVQGAQHHARLALDEHRIDALAPVSAHQSDPTDAAVWTVELAGRRHRRRAGALDPLAHPADLRRRPGRLDADLRPGVVRRALTARRRPGRSGRGRRPTRPSGAGARDAPRPSSGTSRPGPR